MPRARPKLSPPGGKLSGVGLVITGVALLAMAVAPMLAGAQTTTNFGGPRDPGVRGGPAGAGGPISGLNANELRFFQGGQETFQEVDDVAGGLGPRFNMDGCAGCHAFPAVGGTSPQVNPQIAVASKAGADNQVPSFITANGPVREARFPRSPDGSPDGSVHDLFTIVGRSDAPAGCTGSVLPQPNFGQAMQQNNVIFRIPTPTFGSGLISAIPDSTIIANKNADQGTKGALGIVGRANTTSFGDENREGNTQTITRFGWKAQNKSVDIFSGEAYLVEQGVTNEEFTQERGEPADRGTPERDEPPAACLGNGLPEDHTHFDATTPTEVPSDVVQFSTFMRLTAAPAPANFNQSDRNGQQIFSQIGCNQCHTPSLQTGTSSVAALSNKPVNLYSDLLLHNMGTGLADGVSQGAAGPDEFRTAPLWGVGQRIFLLHDGRTRDLVEAIRAHASQNSEANAVINNFNNLGAGQQQDLLNFLRAL